MDAEKKNLKEMMLWSNALDKQVGEEGNHSSV
jgi:hypothetical protein